MHIIGEEHYNVARQVEDLQRYKDRRTHRVLGTTNYLKKTR